MSGTELAALLVPVFGAFGTLLFGFYRYAEARERDFETSRLAQTKAFDKALGKLGKSLEKVAKSSERAAMASERAADEAKERNGHLAEVAADNNKATMAALKVITDKFNESHREQNEILNKVMEIKDQHINEQHVDKQIVGSK